MAIFVDRFLDTSVDRAVAHHIPKAELRAALPDAISAALRRVTLLTAQELTVFHLLGRGCGNRSIAQSLSISERTAKRHVTAILTKLGLESRLQAGLTAMAMTLVAYKPSHGSCDFSQ